MIRPASVAMVLLLAACAAPSQSERGAGALEQAQLLRHERTLPLSFVQVQRALIKHEQTCGPGIRFNVDEHVPSLARITHQATPDAPIDRTTLMVLHLQSLEEDKYRVKTRVYSYYSIPDADVERLYRAILRPEECPA